MKDYTLVKEYNMELIDIKDKLQLIEEALSYVEGIKQAAEDMEYQADDLTSYASQLYETASNVSSNASGALGQLEYARDEIRSHISKEENNAVTAN